MSKEPPITQDDINRSHGMGCQRCGCRDWRTYRTERIRDKIRRIKICRHCSARIMTIEEIRGNLR